jgi:hypothetical protein
MIIYMKLGRLIRLGTLLSKLKTDMLKKIKKEGGVDFTNILV